MQNEYIPGVCNIGRAETRLRWLFGWIALGIYIVLWAVFAALHIAPAWRLLLFFPAAIAALGLLQAKLHFCAKFGLGGVFNFGPNVGKTDTVEQAAYRQKDRKTALLIIGISTLIGVAAAAVAYFIPR